MAREQRLRRALACYVLVATALSALAGVSARASDSDRTKAEPAPHPGCPAREAVWSTVTALVPSAAARLLAAQPRVEIVDFGERYRVRVATDGGVLERVYNDPDRDCDKRRRFAAEFIVLSLLPPEIAMERTAPSSTPVASATPPTAAPGPSTASTASPPSAAATASASGPPASAPQPAATPVPPVVPTEPPPAEDETTDRATAPERHGATPAWTGPAFARIELSALGEASPSIFRAPAFVAWGADLRARMGADRFAAIVGVGYWPRATFVARDVRGSVTRIPVVFGARARAVTRYLELAGDLGIAVAFERYDGVSPHDPAGATRVVPGLETGVIASSPAFFGFAPFVGLRLGWFPLTQELAVAPQGILGNTPSLWIGAALGTSWEP